MFRALDNPSKPPIHKDIIEFMSAVADRIDRTRWGFSDEVDAESAFTRAKEAVVEAIRDEIEAVRRKESK
jgi:hypothetical protein